MIIIDPGHGGSDIGGGSNNFWQEKDLALKISLYQYQRFLDKQETIKSEMNRLANARAVYSEKLNNILAKDEIDVLFTPKVISHFELISQQNSNQNSNQNNCSSKYRRKLVREIADMRSFFLPFFGNCVMFRKRR